MATISASPRVVGERFESPRLSVSFEAPAASWPIPVPVVSPPRPSDIPAVRLAVAALLVFSAALALFLMLPASTAPAPAASVTSGNLPVESSASPAWTVAPGETLWDIASQVSPAEDPRRVVSELQDLNGFGPGHVLQVGEVILVPGDS